MYDLIHIGLHKAGSTFLQQKVFPYHPDIDFEWRKDKEVIYRMLDYDFDSSPNRLTSELESNHTHALGRKCVVFSSERFCGDMLTGRSSRLAIELLAQHFSNTKILLVLRSQYRWIYSAWNQYVQEGGCLCLKDFLANRNSPALPTKPNLSIFKRVMYHRMVEYLFSLFGKEAVKVVFFEDLVSDQNRFLRELYRFAGIDEDFEVIPGAIRPSFPHALATMFRLANHFSQTLHNQAGIFPFGVFVRSRRLFNRVAPHLTLKALTPRVERFVPEWAKIEIKQSNRKLSSLLDMDLSQKGYDM